MRWVSVLLWMFAGCAGPPVAPPPGRVFAERVPGVEGLDNFAKINDGLYRGAQPSDEGFRELQRRGIKTVINLRANYSEREAVEALGMKAVDIPLEAGLFEAESPNEAKLKAFFDVVLDPANQPVFVHCLRGKDRTGALSAVFRVEVEGWTAEDAIVEMRSFGFYDPYQGLLAFVRAYTPRGFKPTPR